MNNKLFRNYYLLSLLGVLLASFYPIWMGISVAVDMARYGTVYAENYPKYIIPYTPIALAVIVGVAILPLLVKRMKKFSLLTGSAVSVAVFFGVELFLENAIIVTKTFTETIWVDAKLESWQMYMCWAPSEGWGTGSYQELTKTEVGILMGEYSPTFKIHFYIISLVLIVSLLNCFYGFAKMIQSGHKHRLKPLVMQSVASVAFLGMCLWACFTAFYRTGSIQVSPLSALLMCSFFILFGLTMGIYVASFTLGKGRLLSVVIPALSASITTLVMYIGEMCLLSGHVYSFGQGFLFDSLPVIVLAPVDLLVILLSGVITALISLSLSKGTPATAVVDESDASTEA